jgi:hypothetical protein
MKYHTTVSVMEHQLQTYLLDLAHAYAGALNWKLSTVGKIAAGYGRFFERLGEGKTFTVRKYDSVVRWFSANWPNDLAWPADVPRPSVSAPSSPAPASGPPSPRGPEALSSDVQYLASSEAEVGG